MVLTEEFEEMKELVEMELRELLIPTSSLEMTRRSFVVLR